MKTHFFSLCFGFLMISGHLLAQSEGEIPGQYIVLIKESVAQPVALQELTDSDRESAANLNNSKRNLNLQLLANLRKASTISEEQVKSDYADAIVGFSASLSPEQVSSLSQNPLVEGVFPDFYVSAGPGTDEGLPEEFSPNGQTTPCAVTNAGGFADGSAKSAWIWILDTGIDLDHPDLNVHAVLPFIKSCVPSQSADDGHGHGTHVAGIAAAKNNGFGIVGVSAGARVVPVKVIPNSGGGGAMSYVLQGLNHVAIYDKKDDIVNLSIGVFPIANCENSNIPLRNAIKNLGLSGTWVCIASGNHAGNAASCLPGCINGAQVYTVGAMTCANTCYGGPNWGTPVVDWVATGYQVYSTFKNGGYATLTGTSQATPVVSGIIHARTGAPKSGGTISCGNNAVPPAAYKKAKRV